MQTSLAELQFPSSCTLFPSHSFSLSLYLALLFFGLIHLFMCLHVCMGLLVCGCVRVSEWVPIHSLMHSFIFIICMLLSQQNLTYFVPLICTYSCSLSLPSPSLSLSFFFLSFFPILTKLSCDFVHLISVCESVVWLSMDFLLVRHAQKKKLLPLPSISWYLFLVSLKSCRVIFVYESLNIFKWFSKIKLTVYNCLGGKSVEMEERQAGV